MMQKYVYLRHIEKLVLFILVFFPALLQGQESGIILGLVTNGLTGAPVAKAQVGIHPLNCGNSKSTDQYGMYFSPLACSTREIQLSVTHSKWEYLDPEQLRSPVGEREGHSIVNIEMCLKPECEEERKRWKVIKRMIYTPLKGLEEREANTLGPKLDSLILLQNQLNDALTTKVKKRARVRLRKVERDLQETQQEFLEERIGLKTRGNQLYHLVVDPAPLELAKELISEGEVEAATDLLEETVKSEEFNGLPPEDRSAILSMLGKMPRVQQDKLKLREVTEAKDKLDKEIVEKREKTRQSMMPDYPRLVRKGYYYLGLRYHQPQKIEQFGFGVEAGYWIWRRSALIARHSYETSLSSGYQMNQTELGLYVLPISATVRRVSISWSLEVVGILVTGSSPTGLQVGMGARLGTGARVDAGPFYVTIGYEITGLNNWWVTSSIGVYPSKIPAYFKRR